MTALASTAVSDEEFRRFVEHVGRLLQLILELEDYRYSAGAAEFDDGRIEITLTPTSSEAA